MIYYETSSQCVVFSDLDCHISLCVVAIINKLLKLDYSLYIILEIYSVSLLAGTQLNQAFFNSDFNNSEPSIGKQLILFVS